MKQISVLLILILLVSVISLNGQTKSSSGTKKSNTSQSTQKKGSTSTQKKTTTKTDPKKKTTDSKKKEEKKGEDTGPKAGVIDPAKADTFRLQVIPLVKFFESSLNFLGDKRNDVSDMQTIIAESYLKWCWDDKVQVEDDLDEARLVPLYKDMPAYLSDVDFFFKGAKFQYTVQDISLETNALGLSYFKVTANRNLRALTVNGDSVNSNKVRYIEVNYDSVKQQLKIVSVYTTKLNEKEDLRNWWNGLSPDWKSILGSELKLEGTLPMSSIESFNDSLATVGGKPKAIMGSEFYRFLDQIINSSSVDLSGRKVITDLTPINRLSDLKSVNISNTGVSDLMPLRNMNKLESLDITNTSVSTLEPLRYCVLITQLKMRGTRVSDISPVASFPGLTILDAGNTGISTLENLEELTAMVDLRINNSKVSDLTPVAGMTKIEMLNISSTQVDNLESLRGMKNLRILMSDSTMISSLAPLDSLVKLQRVYCNNSKIRQKDALNFLKKHPDASLVYASKELAAWWKGMSPEWQKQFNFYMSLNDPPTTEQLHKLVLLDSINVTGRATITSLDPLSKMILMRRLYFPSTGVTSLEPLKELTELKTISMNNTKVSNLQPLTGSSQLEVLFLDNTPVADLTPLYQLDKLGIVYADNSAIDDAQADKFYAKKPKTLLIYQTYENDEWWKGLSDGWKTVMKEQVKLDGKPDKHDLQRMANLRAVSFTENFQISDITPLLHLTRLVDLRFSGTTVASLDPVAKMPKLQVLYCSKNPISSLTPITGLPALKELDFSNTQVEDIDALQNMMQLELLKFNGTQVKNLKYLQKLVNIRVIEFYNTRVGNIDVLEGMTKLETVKMFNTKVSAKKVEKLRASRPKCEIVYY
jgi:hypothetical protein